MIKPVINFAHANGFPAKVYAKLFSYLESDFEIIYKDMYAHDSSYLVSSDWMSIADELIEFIENNATAPIIGLGHSFGATITLNAAFKRPDLFKSIILMDPVILNGWRATLAPIADHFDLIKHFSPAKKSKDRRTHWPDMATAENYFKSKGFFKRLDPDCLDDYLKYGLTKTDDGYELTFKLKHELEIFSGFPHHFHKYKGQLKSLPGLIISGESTNVSVPTFMKRLSKQQSFKWEKVKGGHMFPLEEVELAANVIKSYLHEVTNDM